MAVQTVLKSSGVDTPVRDLSDAKVRAAVLGVLATHRSKFSAPERAAYDVFRDECIKLARGTGSVANASESLGFLTRFLKPATPQTEPKREVSVAAPRVSRGSMSFVPRTRAGSHFNVSIADSALPQAPISAPDVQEPTETNVVPQEVSSIVTTAVPEIAVLSPKTPSVAPVPVEEQVLDMSRAEASVSEAARAPETSQATLSPSDSKAIADEIEDINASLNEFAHGKAFQWLHDQSTGYRVYMTKLLAAREAADVAQKGGTSEGLRAQLEELRTLADGVRTAVGGGTPKASAEEAIAVPQAAPVAEASLGASIPESPTVQGTIPVADLEEPDNGFTPIASQQEASFVPPVTEVQAPSFVMPDQPVPNPELHSPEVEQGLNTLLEQWLGGGGWLGLKKGGVEHPDWKRMAPLTVGQVVRADGFVPQGMTHELMENLAANLREWARLYSISLVQHEDTTIDEIMHRVVLESLKK